MPLRDHFHPPLSTPAGQLHLRFLRAVAPGDRAQESRKKGSQVLGVEPHDSGERKERFFHVIRS